MSDVAIRAALEQRLAAQAPALSTAYENVDFSPADGVPYQRVNLMRATPENPTFDGFTRELGILQVTLMYPLGAGPGVAELRAKALKEWFPRRLNISSGGIVVVIDGAAYVMAGFRDEDRWAVPVRIPYFSNISS